MRGWTRRLLATMPASWSPAARRFTVAGAAAGAAVFLAAAAMVMHDLIAARSVPGLGALLALGAGAGVASLAPRLLGEPVLADGRAHVDVQSVWSVAGAVLLPWHLAALLALLVEATSSPASRRYGPVNRAFNTGVAALATAAGSVAFRLVPGAADFGAAPATPAGTGTALGAALVAVAAYVTVNAGIVAEASRRVTGGSRLGVLGGLDGVAAELAVCCVGVLAAGAWHAAPALLLATVPVTMLLQRSLMYGDLLAAAHADAKTGLPHAARWRALAARHLARDGTGRLAVALVDIDHFKRINDTYGHLVGDEVLCAVARSLSEASRPGDVVGRFGGEEFAVLLVDCPPRHLAAAAERLRRAVAERGPGTLPAVTVSVGAAAAPAAAAGDGAAADSQALDALLAGADRALYAAKAAGRDRVCVEAVSAGDRRSSGPSRSGR